MFYPLRKLEDIQIDGSYWDLFERELFLFKRNETQQCGKRDLKYCRTLRIGASFIAILQNNRITSLNSPSTNSTLTVNLKRKIPHFKMTKSSVTFKGKTKFRLSYYLISARHIRVTIFMYSCRTSGN